MNRSCPKCGESKPLTIDNFYLARPRKGHKSTGWQSYCIDCWRAINRANKVARRIKHHAMALLGLL